MRPWHPLATMVEYVYGIAPVLAALKDGTRRITQLLVYQSDESIR